MSRFLVDTNVFSKIFGGNAAVRSYVESRDSVIDTVIYIECLQGSKSNIGKSIVKTYIDNFPLLLISPRISKRAIHLVELYSNSYGLLLADSLIAATAIENDLTVLTYNVGDFKFIPGLKYLTPEI